MREPLIHLEFASDFDELCLIADQTQSVDIDLLEGGLAVAVSLQEKAARGKLRAHHLHALGDFDDIS